MFTFLAALPRPASSEIKLNVAQIPEFLKGRNLGLASTMICGQVKGVVGDNGDNAGTDVGACYSSSS